MATGGTASTSSVGRVVAAGFLVAVATAAFAISAPAFMKMNARNKEREVERSSYQRQQDDTRAGFSRPNMYDSISRTRKSSGVNDST